jgi:hypothetical protein
MAVTLNASTTAGLVQTADTSGVLALQTAGTTAVTVNASQNVGIGTASPSARLSIVAGTMQSQLLLGVNTSNANYGSISLNGINADSTRLGFTGGGTGDNTLYIDVPTSGQCAFRTGGTQAMILNASNNLQTIGTISVGNATPSTSGAGITFPATQSASSNANTLDDYEEGTWTPTLTGSSVSGSQTYGTRFGGYTKIGRQVSLNYFCALTAKGTISGNIYLSGYPFTSSSDNDSVRYGRNIIGFENLAANWVFITSINDTNIAYSYIAGLKTAASTSAVTNLTDADLTNTSQFSGSVLYNAS